MNRQLAFRIKREALEKRNHIPRAQQNRIVNKNFLCIRIADILRAVEFDLAYGFLRYYPRFTLITRSCGFSLDGDRGSQHDRVYLRSNSMAHTGNEVG